MIIPHENTSENGLTAFCTVIMQHFSNHRKSSKALEVMVHLVKLYVCLIFSVFTNSWKPTIKMATLSQIGIFLYHKDIFPIVRNNCLHVLTAALVYHHSESYQKKRREKKKDSVDFCRNQCFHISWWCVRFEIGVINRTPQFTLKWMHSLSLHYLTAVCINSSHLKGRVCSNSVNSVQHQKTSVSFVMHVTELGFHIWVLICFRVFFSCLSAPDT